MSKTVSQVIRVPPQIAELVRFRIRPLESRGEVLFRLLRAEIAKMEKEKTK